MVFLFSVSVPIQSGELFAHLGHCHSQLVPADSPSSRHGNLPLAMRMARHEWTMVSVGAAAFLDPVLLPGAMLEAPCSAGSLALPSVVFGLAHIRWLVSPGWGGKRAWLGRRGGAGCIDVVSHRAETLWRWFCPSSPGGCGVAGVGVAL